jgi:hypothetical protein
MDGGSWLYFFLFFHLRPTSFMMKRGWDRQERGSFWGEFRASEKIISRRHRSTVAKPSFCDLSLVGLIKVGRSAGR